MDTVEDATADRLFSNVTGASDPGLEEAAIVLVYGRELQLVVCRPHASRDEPDEDRRTSQQ